MSRNSALAMVVLLVIAAVLGFLAGDLKRYRSVEDPDHDHAPRPAFTQQELREQLRQSGPEQDGASSGSEALRRENARLRAELEAARGGATKTGGAAKDPAGAAAADPDAPSDPARKNEAEIDALVAEADWLSYSKAIIAWVQADEEARRLGKPPKYDPEVIKVLSEMTLRMEKLKGLLGLEDVEDVYAHERIAPTFGEAWMKALGIELDEDQERRLRESSIEDARSRREEKQRNGKLSPLADLLWEGQRAVQDDERMRGVLTPAQYEKWGSVSDGNPFWGHEAERVRLAAEDANGAAGLVRDHWARELGLDDTHRTVLDEVAANYARESRRLELELRARYPTGVPREARMRLGVDLLRLQVEAEQGLAERLTLTPEQLERVRAGTGSILQIEWK